MKIKTWRDPYNAGFSVTKPREIEFHEGLTVLVGCNGAGKSTLLRNIEEHCKDQKIPYFFYDNLRSGGSNALQEAMDFGLSEFLGLYASSEGEAIKENIARRSQYFLNFIKTGIINDRQNRMLQALNALSDKPNDTPDSDTRVFLFDAVDSGMSVDAVVEVKALFDQIVEACKKESKHFYILISANEYELARECDCFDVNNGKYIRFSDYMDYRDFICKSRVRKEKRYADQKIWIEKQKEKELAEYLKILQTSQKQKEKLLSSERIDEWKLRHIEEAPKDFLRRARFISEEDVESL